MTSEVFFKLQYIEGCFFFSLIFFRFRSASFRCFSWHQFKVYESFPIWRRAKNVWYFKCLWWDLNLGRLICILHSVHKKKGRISSTVRIAVRDIGKKRRRVFVILRIFGALESRNESFENINEQVKFILYTCQFLAMPFSTIFLFNILAHRY